MHVVALAVDLHLPQSRSLKDKRAVLRPVLEGLRHRHHVSVAETDHQDQWQRATLGVAVVSGSVHQVEAQLDEIERFVWSFPEVEVAGTQREWMEFDR